MTAQTITDIDFQSLWQTARKERAWSSKGPKDWDKKASSFSKRNQSSPFIDLVLEKLPLKPHHTVLDIGSGPGTLSLPIAKFVSHVTAIDYSQTMLTTLKDFANQKQLNNIQTINCAWEDDWTANGIIPHDISIASRSLNVYDLKVALKKIIKHSKEYIFLADRISPTPFEPEVFEAIGRPFNSGPDYIYTFNILYQLGIHPNIHILELDNENIFPSFDDLLDSYKWMLKETSPAEEHALINYLKEKTIKLSDQSIKITRNHPPRWALLWWHNSKHFKIYNETI